MEKDNKKFLLIICILVGIITFLIGLIIGMFINTKAFQPSQQDDAAVVGEPSPAPEATQVTEKTEPETNVVDQGNNDSSSGSTSYSNSGERELVYSGYKFSIPNDYSVMFMDYGPVVYMNDIFQTRLVVKEEDTATFKGYYDNPATLTEKAVNAGWTITKECKAYTVDGKDYFIFCGEVDSEKYVVFRTQIDDSHVFAGNMAVLSSSIDEEDYLNIISGLAKSVEKSDKPDTTDTTFYSSGSSSFSGESKSESTIKTKTFSLTYKIPEGIYSTDPIFVYGDDSDDPVYVTYNDSFMDSQYDMVDVWIRCQEGGAKTYVSTHYIAEGNEVKTFEENGRTFYYVERTREKNGETINQFLIATDINSDGWIYEIKTYATSKKNTLEGLKPFFLISVE